MVEICFLGPIQKESLHLELKNLRELKELLQKDESLKAWLELCAISLNDRLISSLDTPLQNGDIIALLPPVSGG